MATIQEALRELRAQRTIKENKKINIEKKTLDEDVTEIEAIDLTEEQENKIVDMMYEQAKNDITQKKVSHIDYLKILEDVCGFRDLRNLKNSNTVLNKIAAKVALKLTKDFNKDVYATYTVEPSLVFTFHKNRYSVDNHLYEETENCEDGNCNTVNECDQALQENAVLLVDQDGDIEKPDFNLQKFYSESCNKENITEAEENAEATEEEVFEQPEDTEGDETQADEPQEDTANELTVGAILSKFQDKDENAIVKVAPIELEDKTYNINLDVNEDEEGNLTLTGVLTPVEAVEESLNEKVDPDKKVTPENIAKLEEFKNVKKK